MNIQDPHGLRNCLLEMHACYMEAGSGEPLNKQQRHRHRMALIATRRALEVQPTKPLFLSGVELHLDTVEQITGQVNHRGERRPFDIHTLHMLGGRATADASAALTMSHVETEYLAELVRLARSVLEPSNSCTKQ